MYVSTNSLYYSAKWYFCFYLDWSFAMLSVLECQRASVMDTHKLFAKM